MPRSYLSGIFGASPVKPMEQHMDKVFECVKQLIPFTEAVLNGNKEQRNSIQLRIVELEKEADELKKDLRLHLPTSLFMPVSRRDLLEVLTMQDKVAGTARDIAGLIVGREMVLPSSMHASFRALVKESVAAAQKAQEAINELDELVETGFGPKVVDLIERMLDELDSIEHESDEQLRELRHQLLSLESSLNPVDVMFLYKILDWTATVADRAQQVGSRLQLVLAK